MKNLMKEQKQVNAQIKRLKKEIEFEMDLHDGSCTCSICKDIRMLNKRNMEITYELRQKKKNAKVASVAELTVEAYKQLKAQGKSDSDIKSEFKMSNSTLYRWKRKNGLVQSQTRKETTVMPKEVTNEEVVKQLNAAMERVAPLQETNEKLKAENEKLNEQIKNLGEFSSGQLEEIKGLNKQVRQHSEDNERLEKHLREADQKLNQLTESYIALEKNYEAANLELEKLRAQNEELRTQNSGFQLDSELKDEMVEVLNNKLSDHFAVYQSNQDVSALDKVIKRAEQLKMLQ